jgi:hypothetical protein
METTGLWVGNDSKMSVDGRREAPVLSLRRIYHLPFDQQYDTTVPEPEPERGELYLSTVAEAE